MIKNIVFDLGKVLVGYDWEAYLETFDFDTATKKVLGDAIFLNEDWELGDCGVATKEDWLSYFIDNAPTYETQIRMVYEKLGDCIYSLPYTEKLIALYRKKGFHLYFLSNYSEGLYEKTKDKLSFIETFDGGVFSFQEKCIKPDARIYHLLLERYQLIPRETVFFDDRPENVDAAMRIGINGMVFNEEIAKRELQKQV